MRIAAAYLDEAVDFGAQEVAVLPLPLAARESAQCVPGITDSVPLTMVLDGQRESSPVPEELRPAGEVTVQTWRSSDRLPEVGRRVLLDYLLRDSHHASVAYGRFDHFRLVDTMRILPQPPQEKQDDARREEAASPEVGITSGGLQSAEALLLARYSMFTQVYFHRTRRIYDVHLADFLAEWLPTGVFPVELDRHLHTADDTILNAVHSTARGMSRRANRRRLQELALRLVDRTKRFDLLYERSVRDVARRCRPMSRVKGGRA